MKKFLVIDDHPVTRTGLKLVINQQYSDCIVDEAESEGQVMEKVAEGDYDLIFLDIILPGANALGLLKFLVTGKPGSKVLIFTMKRETALARHFMEAGAKGYITKDAPMEEVLRATNIILDNKNYYSQTFIENLVNEKTGKGSGHAFSKLTKREYTIANLLLQGKTVTEISTILDIKTSTTGTHKAKIFEKLNVRNLLELKDLAENN